MAGPASGTGCLVCESPQSAMINAALMSGQVSGRAIARQFGIPKDSVSRHAYKRHPGYVPPGSPEATGEDRESGPDEKTERERLVELRGTLEKEVQRSARADTSRELRQVISRIGEIDGTSRPKAASVEDVQGLPEQIAAWFRALEPYPEAREAMFLATDGKLLEAAGVAKEVEEEST